MNWGDFTIGLVVGVAIMCAVNIGVVLYFNGRQFFNAKATTKTRTRDAHNKQAKG